MRVLVTVASKHGSTAEIGSAIARTLAALGLEVDQARPQDVRELTGYDVVVLGSGVYAGHWMQEAKAFAHRHAAVLRERRTWLFSSGPLGDPPLPAGDPVDIADLVGLLHPEGEMVFAGRLDRESLGFGERAVVATVKAPYGDFRDWAAIEAWAGEIAGALVALPATA